MSVSRLGGIVVNERDASNLIFSQYQGVNLVEESGHSSQSAPGSGDQYVLIIHSKNPDYSFNKNIININR